LTTNPQPIREIVESSITRDIDSFPAKEPRVHRPPARSQKGQRCANRAQQDARTWIVTLRQRTPEPNDDHEGTRNWRPQSGNQESTASNGEGVENRCPHRHASLESVDSTDNQGNSGNDPQQ
jgi:hypothetical protein